MVTLTVGALAAPPIGGAQQTSRVPRIGVLFGNNATVSAPFYEAFKQGLREHGYVEGQNVVLERRYGEARAERLAEAAAELVRIRVDVILAGTDLTTATVKRQTRTIPIVMVTSADPVGTGFVASLARPGGNITGLSTFPRSSAGNGWSSSGRPFPELSRVAGIWNPDVRGALLDYKELEGPARTLRLQLQSLEVSHADDLAHAFSAIVEAARGGDRNRAESRSQGESRPARELRPEASLAVHVWDTGLRGGRRAHGLRGEQHRPVPARRHVRGQDPEGRQARRPSRRAAHEVRAGDQPCVQRKLTCSAGVSPAGVRARAP